MKNEYFMVTIIAHRIYAFLKLLVNCSIWNWEYTKLIVILNSYKFAQYISSSTALKHYIRIKLGGKCKTFFSKKIYLMWDDEHRNLQT